MRTRRILALAGFALLALTGAVSAQPNPAWLPDSLWVRLDDDTNFTARHGRSGRYDSSEWITCGYYYQMYADSTCATDFTVTAFKINGHRWKLLNWSFRRTVNAPANVLNANSRTMDTTLHAGDTLTFYRELHWRNPIDGITATDNYKSYDTLTCAVELVSSTDGHRIALLDSIGVMPCPVTGVPRIHGTLPIIVWPHWVVPPVLDGKRAFMRVRVNAEGTGAYDYTRQEEVTHSLWRRLQDAYFMNTYLPYLGQIYAKPGMADYVEKGDTSSLLHTHLVPGSSGIADVEFTTATDGKSTSLALYDAAGHLTFVPYNAPSSDGRTERLQYQFESSGFYIVCLIHGGSMVATNSITIQR